MSGINFSTMMQDLFEVLMAGLILGAGLPALFALGVRWGNGTNGNHPSAIAKVGSFVCFAIIVVMIVVGILWITQGVIYESFGVDLFGTGGKGH